MGLGTEVLMTKRRTITGFVAVALLAVAASAATMHSHWPLNLPRAFPGNPSFNERWVDVRKLPAEQLDDQSLVFFERAKALGEKSDGQSQ
jgi:hypothetical protein